MSDQKFRVYDPYDSDGLPSAIFFSKDDADNYRRFMDVLREYGITVDEAIEDIRYNRGVS